MMAGKRHETASPADHSDRELVRMARDNRGAYRLVMDRYGPPLYKFSLNRLSNSEDALDAVQETFISAWEALPRFDDSKPLAPWLYRIALNKCRDSLRRSRTRNIFARFCELPSQVLSSIPDGGPSAEEIVYGNFVSDTLSDAVSALPSQLREPLVLTVWDGFSQREAAAILDIKPKAVENRVYRAKQHLAASLDRSDFQPFFLEPTSS